MAMPWFRYYSEIVRDRKIIMAAKCAGVSKLEMVGAWSIILCLANDSPQRGNLLVTLQERFTNDDIEIEFGTDQDKTGKIIHALLKYGMLQEQDGTYSVKNWNKRQFESDNSTSRVKKHREKQQDTPDVTLLKRFSNAPDTYTETDTESDPDTEKELNIYTCEPDSFTKTKQWIEKCTGYPSTPGDITAIKEMVNGGVVEDDIKSAVEYFVSQNKTAKGAGTILKSVMFSAAKRIQSGVKSNGGIKHEPRTITVDFGEGIEERTV